MSSVISKPVSDIPSGANRLSRKYASSRLPLTASTALPTKSILVPYSQRVPGSVMMGVFSAAFWQVMIPGVPVFSM